MTLSIIAPIRVKLYQCPHWGCRKSYAVVVRTPREFRSGMQFCPDCRAPLVEAGPSQKIDVLVFPEVAKDLMALDRAEREAEPKKKRRGTVR